ncbi:uncharacterized protein PAC_11462 [Phialocephala subalpina]|uniref:Uncharacterized protein n=1 Tax=Phialocephala subalpina TaxID=576137 RepID=A0A1L7X960_9HELO|nr:uncharacterized protein PAC_11462 [Phialocephala subalpina]
MLTILFGIVATITAVGAIWVARRQNARRAEPDMELGLMGPTTSNPTLSAGNPIDSEEEESPTYIGRHAEQESQAHQVIGDILELVSRHLRIRR